MCVHERDVLSGRAMFEGRTLPLRVVLLLSRLVTEGRRAGRRVGQMAGRGEGEYPFLRRRRWLRVGRVLLQWHPDRRRQAELRPGSGGAGGLVVVRYDRGVHGAAQELRCVPRPVWAMT